MEKRKPILIDKINEQNRELERLKLEQAEAEREKLKQLEKQQLEVPVEKDVSSVATVKQKSILGKFFSFIGKVITLIFNLLITIVEQVQWLVIAVILSIAATIITNHYGVDIKDLFINFKL